MSSELLKSLGLDAINAGTYLGNGEWSSATSGELITPVNPTTGEPIAQPPRAVHQPGVVLRHAFADGIRHAHRGRIAVARCRARDTNGRIGDAVIPARHHGLAGRCGLRHPRCRSGGASPASFGD